MGGQHKMGSTFRESATPAIPDFVVSGDILPDAKGDYFSFETYSEKPEYRRDDGLWFIWWDGFESWNIASLAPPLHGPSWWTRGFPDPVGEYDPQDDATGNAIVSAGA
jgi:hypothetical protein